MAETQEMILYKDKESHLDTHPASGGHWNRLFHYDIKGVEFLKYDYFIDGVVYTKFTKEFEEAFMKVITWEKLHD